MNFLHKEAVLIFTTHSVTKTTAGLAVEEEEEEEEEGEEEKGEEGKEEEVEEVEKV